MNSIPAKKYTKALVEALETKEMKKALELLDSISKCFNNKKFNSIINSPTMPKQKKFDFITSIFDIKDKKILNFLKLLNQKNRLDEIPNIYDELNRYIHAKNNEYELLVLSSFEIDSKDINDIKKKLGDKLGISLYATYKKMDIEGVKLFVDGVGIETSLLKNSFSNNLKHHILKAFN